MELSELKGRGRELGYWLNLAGLIGPGMELGVAYGEHAEQILETWIGNELYLVDPWALVPGVEYRDIQSQMNFEATRFYCHGKLARFKGRHIEVRMNSDAAFQSNAIPVLDWCYIDGNHQFPQVRFDIANWWTRVRPGGLFGGHDYMDVDTPEYRCDVKSEVDRFAGMCGLKVHLTEADSSWWIRKPHAA
jgi:hypothetical protein